MQVKTMYRAMTDYGVLEGDALWLARAVLSPSRLWHRSRRQVVDTTGVLFMDKKSYCRQLVLLRIAAIWTYPWFLHLRASG